MTAATCHGITRDGQRCRARPLAGTTYCVNHSPDVSDAQRKAWAAKGGANSAAKVRARRALPAEGMTIEEVASWLGVVYRGVIAKTIEPAVGNAASNIARTLATLREATETEERLTALEEALKTHQGHNGRFSA